MAYFYRTRKKCYIKNEAKEEKFFAVPVTKGTLGMEEIAKEISSKSIAKESAILAVLKELSIIMKNKLGDGYNLKLDGIGTFGVAITSLGFDKEENITPRRVKFSKMTFSKNEKGKTKASFIHNGAKHLNYSVTDSQYFVDPSPVDTGYAIISLPPSDDFTRSGNGYFKYVSAIY